MPAPRPAWSDDDIEAFRELARTFFEKECAPHEERWCEQQHVDREVWRKAGDLGLLCPSIPTEYGGTPTSEDADVELDEVERFCTEHDLWNQLV